MKGPSQKQRVLRALQAVGPAGLTQVDFLAPSVCDQGNPITRVAARINELRDEGHEIVEAGVRDQCRVYKLVSSPWQPIETPARDPEPVLAASERARPHRPDDRPVRCRMSAPDLLAVLEDIERLAKSTQLNLAAGLATSGVTGLRKIELAARDARHWAAAQEKAPA